MFTLSVRRVRVFCVQLGEYTAAIDLDRVLIFRNGTLVATGRWTGRRIEDRPAGVLAEDPGAEERLFATLEAGLLEEAAREIREMQAQAYDDEGVDRTLIRWMLSLTPRERLRVLADQTRSLMRILGRTDASPRPQQGSGGGEGAEEVTDLFVVRVGDHADVVFAGQAIDVGVGGVVEEDVMALGR